MKPPRQDPTSAAPAADGYATDTAPAEGEAPANDDAPVTAEASSADAPAVADDVAGDDVAAAAADADDTALQLMVPMMPWS